MHISFGKNFRDTVPVGRDITFEQFVKLVTEVPVHVGRLHWTEYTLAGKLERGRDKDTRWFIPAVFARPERRADAVSALTGFVCDFDDGHVDKELIRDFGQKHSCNFVAWTSYSHGLDGLEKWRVFFPYQHPIAPTDHAKIFAWFNQEFGGHLDPRCATVSQLWYLRGRAQGAPSSDLFFETDRRCLDPRQILDAHANPPPAQVGAVPVGILSTLAARAKDNDDLTARGPVSIRDVKSALAALDPNLYGGYTEWLNMGMAIYDGTKGSDEGLCIFDEWSETCPNYGGSSNIVEKWRSFGGRAGLSRITVASLFKQAQDAGWSPGNAHIPQQPPVHGAPAQTPASQPPAHTLHNPGSVPSPVQLVLPLTMTAPVAPPENWQPHKTEFAMQKKIDDPENGQGRWVTCMRFRVLSLELLKTIGEGDFNATVRTETADGVVDATFNAGLLASPAEFRALLLDRGILVNVGEFKDIQEMIVEWLKKIQITQQTRQSFTHFGWMEKDTVPIGFALAETAYHTDGRVENGIKVAGIGGATIAKHYLPQGNLSTWKSISAFLASQNRPELMAILSTAFGSPLMKFSGHSGAVVSIVSTASGVGKSTALSLAQSVWGSPKAAMHTATDTAMSLSSKMGFTKDLPAYWDDIKGEKTFEQFASTIYQITQGKEKSRLTQTAELREVQNWNCLAVIAANDSMIDIVKRFGKGTDAGAARIFEIRLEHKPTMSQQATFFDGVSTNYGHAGAEYARWLAVNHAKAKTLVEQISDRLYTSLQVESEERFWVAAMSTMIAGAMIAKSIGLVDFDVPSLTDFLKTRFLELRSGKTTQMKENDPGPVVADMIYDHQQTTLRIEALPFKNRTKVQITRAPKNNEVDILIAEQDGIVRIRKSKLGEWCRSRAGLSMSTLIEKLKQAGAIIERNVDPIAGAPPYSSYNRTTCYDIDLKKLNLQVGGADEVPDSP